MSQKSQWLAVSLSVSLRRLRGRQKSRWRQKEGVEEYTSLKCKLRRNVMKMKIDRKKEKQQLTSESEWVLKERPKNETKVERDDTCLTL